MRNADGSILPLALVMTLTILLAGVSIGTVVLEGVKRAKDTDDSVGAYYMADAGVERQLFEVRKNNEPLSYVNTLGGAAFGGTWVSTGALDQPSQKIIPLIPTNGFAVLDLFDPDKINEKPGIGAVKITWDSACAPASSNLEASYASWDLGVPAPQWPTTNQYAIESKVGGGTVTINLNDQRAYRLRLRAFDCDAKNIHITTYDAIGNPKAYPGDITLTAEGTYGRATQKISVLMPKQDILSGLFGYVIFSECSLYKGEGPAPLCP